MGRSVSWNQLGGARRFPSGCCCQSAPRSRSRNDRTWVRKPSCLSLHWSPHNSTPKTLFTITSCKRLLTDAREIVVVQLQFLDLMIPKECGAVPMDAATRADLIDLMARVLVVVFHEEGVSVNDRRFVQCQDQTGAPGSQGDRLPPAVQQKTSTTE